MAVYEALLLNTVVPQIQAAQAGDSYVMVVNATTPALRITQTGTGNALEVEDSANPDSSPFVVDASGNVGIGANAPVNGLSVFTYGTQWTGHTANTYPQPAGNIFFQTQGVANSNNWFGMTGNYGSTTGSANLLLQANLNNFNQQAGNYIASEAQSATSADLTFGKMIGGASTGANATKSEMMRLDASGNLAIGTPTPNSYGSTTTFTINGTTYSELDFEVGGTLQAYISGVSGGLEISADGSRFISLRTDNTERARITSGGYFKASNSGSYIDPATFHEFTQTANSEALQVRATNASYTNNVFQARASRNTTDNSFYYISCFNDGASNYRMRVADSGDVTNVNNSYGAISDQKMKTDIVDAGSQWSDIKALRFRKFKMKDDPSGLVQLGVVAQEVELTSPGLVDEHQDRDAEGNDLGTTTKSVKTSVLLMKAAVALQEAMARIETLEAKIAALEAK